jgi:hypothetical protein
VIPFDSARRIRECETQLSQAIQTKQIMVRIEHPALIARPAKAAGRICSLAFAVLFAAESARAEEKIDTEHIFGFTEGSDIGEKGEKEGENDTLIRHGRAGDYTAVKNATAFRYGVTDNFRASIGALFDEYAIHDVPGLQDRDAFNFAGLTTEFRWKLLDRSPQAPGVTFSFAPEWRRIDYGSGARADTYAFPVEVLTDYAVIPEKLFTALNVNYQPAFTSSDGHAHRSDSQEASGAAAYGITPEIFIGAELRHLLADKNGFLDAHALFVGPSVFVKLSETVNLKLAWSIQIPDETTNQLNLAEFERHQVLAQLVKSF